MNIGFWILTIGSLLVVGTIMGWLGWLARKVPEGTGTQKKYRLNADQIRLLSYVVMVLVLLIAAMYELSKYKNPYEENTSTGAEAPRTP